MEGKSTQPETPKWKSVVQKYGGSTTDFQIRVHVIEARELKPRDENGMSDPVCFVTALDQKKNTITHHKTTVCTWDHLMFFEYKLTPEEFFKGKIKLSIFDANTVKRDVEIGTFELDTQYVYDQPSHEIYRRWLALFDKSGKFPGIQGYLRISAVVLAPGDQAPAHNEIEEDDEGGKEGDLQSMVLVPPTIETRSCSLDVNVYKADSLPKMDQMGKCDGYVIVKFEGVDLKTEVKKNTYTPDWLEKISIPVTLPTMADVITLQVNDWDAGPAGDDIVGTEFFKLTEVISKNWADPRWVNIYGSPTNDSITKKDLLKKMNLGYVEGTNFRGRILVSAECVDVPANENSKPKKSLINGAKEPTTENWLLRIDLLEASEIPIKGDIVVEISIGSFSKESKKCKVENGASSIYLAIDDLTFSYPKDLTQVPDLIINLYESKTIGANKKLGYFRIKANEISSYNQPSWTMLKNDPFTEKEDNQVAGFILFKAELIALGGSKPSPRQAIVAPKLKKYVLRAHIYQAKDLPAADENGFSDPYCVVRVGKVNQKTKTIKETLFPIWYETLTLNVQLPEDLKTGSSEVHVTVFDWDAVTSDDYLGRFRVPIASIKEEFNPNPSWYPLFLKDPQFTQGEILASFQLIAEENLSKYPTIDITPKSKDCVLEIDVIGLRNLLGYNLLPISNPFLEFDAGLATNRVKTKSSNKPNGTNPIFLQTVSVPVRIPEDKVFSPPVNIRVLDDRLIHKPLVAARSINLAPFIPWTKEAPTLQLENLKPQVDEIPGAKGLKEEPPVEELKLPKQEEIAIDIHDDNDESKPLLDEEKQHLQKVRDAVLRGVQNRDPNFVVKESYLKGAEEEKVDENKREIVKTELEYFLAESPFNVYKLYRGKKVKGRPQTYEVGEFKGKLKLNESGKPSGNKEDLSQLFKPTEYVVRVYILEGFQLVPKDSDGNNPYIVISNGKDTITDKDNKKQSTSRPQFYRYYQFNCTFPHQTSITIDIWDWDADLDDLIGSTTIDLENRIYSEKWKKYKLKPIEYRTLWNPSSSNAQGQISLWVDIMTPQEAAANPPENIHPPTQKEYELRAIVWETRKVALKDNNTGSDIFVVGYPEGEGYSPQNTDTHWKSKDGTGLFNWRFKFPVILPAKGPTNFKLQVWDQDVMNPNDAICEANLNLKSLYNRAYKKESRRENIEQQWVAMTHPASSGVQGEVLVSLELLSVDEAKAFPCGLGRSEPNMNPRLEEPKRPADSFAPWNIKKQGERAINSIKNKLFNWKTKAMMICICIVIVIVIILVLKFAFAIF